MRRTNIGLYGAVSVMTVCLYWIIPVPANGNEGPASQPEAPPTTAASDRSPLTFSLHVVESRGHFEGELVIINITEGNITIPRSPRWIQIEPLNPRTWATDVIDKDGKVRHVIHFAAPTRRYLQDKLEIDLRPGEGFVKRIPLSDVPEPGEYIVSVELNGRLKPLEPIKTRFSVRGSLMNEPSWPLKFKSDASFKPADHASPAHTRP